MIIPVQTLDRLKHGIRVAQDRRGQAPARSQQKQAWVGSFVPQSVVGSPVRQRSVPFPGCCSPHRRPQTAFPLDLIDGTFNAFNHAQPTQGLFAIRMELFADSFTPVAEQLIGQVPLISQRSDDKACRDLVRAGRPSQIMEIQVGDGRCDDFTLPIQHGIMDQRYIEWSSLVEHLGTLRFFPPSLCTIPLRQGEEAPGRQGGG